MESSHKIVLEASTLTVRPSLHTSTNTGGDLPLLSSHVKEQQSYLLTKEKISGLVVLILAAEHRLWNNISTGIICYCTSIIYLNTLKHLHLACPGLRDKFSLHAMSNKNHNLSWIVDGLIQVNTFQHLFYTCFIIRHLPTSVQRNDDDDTLILTCILYCTKSVCNHYNSAT